MVAGKQTTWHFEVGARVEVWGGRAGWRSPPLFARQPALAHLVAQCLLRDVGQVFGRFGKLQQLSVAHPRIVLGQVPPVTSRVVMHNRAV